MKPPSHRVVGNKKYVWDGATYPDAAAADRVAETYRQAGFDVQAVAEEGVVLLFTRREAAAGPAKS